MPVLTPAQLQELVDEARLGAISVDTNVFHRFGYNLEAASLLALTQFPAHGISHLVTDIVSGEVRAHMVENEAKAVADLKAALRRYAKVRRRNVGETNEVAQALDLDDDLAASAKERWDRFVVATDATPIAADQIDAAELVRRYFGTVPPFEARAEKKEEFPDAIALLELEAHGEQIQRHVLAVTRDGGWALFAESARWVIVVEDLPAAIGLLHSADAIAAERAVTLLANPIAGVRDDVDTALGAFIDDLDPEIEAESYMEFNAEFTGAAIVDIHPVEPTSATVLESDADTVTLSFGVKVDVEVEADFSFYVHDSVDDDYLGMGSSSRTCRVTLTAPVTLRVPRGVAEEDGAVSVRTERLRSPVVDFGYVEPDGWRDE